MEYHRDAGQEDYKKLVEIMEKAKGYFMLKMEEERAKGYLDLLYKNAKTAEEKAKWDKEKFVFRNKLRDGDWVKKALEKAEKATFPLTQDAV